MRNVNCNILSGSDHSSVNGNQIDANQLLAASFQAYFGDNTAAGTFKLQVSNDINKDRYQASDFTVSQWVDLPNQAANITSGSSALLTVANMSYRWIRAVYTDTAAGVQTISTITDIASSLNNTYFLLNSGNDTHKYYIWFNVSGGGTDPAVPGRTGAEVDISTGDSANTIATAVATAIAALNSTNDFTASASTNIVTVTNKATGPYTAAIDVSTHFTFAVTGGGTSTVNVNMNALSV